MFIRRKQPSSFVKAKYALEQLVPGVFTDDNIKAVDDRAYWESLFEEHSTSRDLCNSTHTPENRVVINP